MKAVGIIAEYNPMHQGHIYQIQEAKRRSRADLCVIVMSGDFVQRGEPALVSKYVRAKTALQHGADLVLELPTVYAASSAERFASGGISTLEALGVQAISFGSESGNLTTLQAAADVLSKEPPAYKKELRAQLSSGLTFPQARAKALMTYWKESGHDSFKNRMNGFSADSLLECLSAPNDLLAIEYLKAIKHIRYSPEIIPIRRIGAGHDAKIQGSQEYFSASAIRSALLLARQKKSVPSSYTQAAPLARIQDALAAPIQDDVPLLCADDIASLLYAKLEEIWYRSEYKKGRAIEHLKTYSDCSPSLAAKIFLNFNAALPLNEYISKIKTRDLTRSRISRTLLHIFLDITEEKASRYQVSLPYIRVLGFTRKGQTYLHESVDSCPVPLITKPSAAVPLLVDDIHAANLYNQIAYQKSGVKLSDEFHAGILRL